MRLVFVFGIIGFLAVNAEVPTHFDKDGFPRDHPQKLFINKVFFESSFSENRIRELRKYFKSRLKVPDMDFSKINFTQKKQLKTSMGVSFTRSIGYMRDHLGVPMELSTSCVSTHF